jgi:hypothetical protein
MTCVSRHSEAGFRALGAGAVKAEKKEKQSRSTTFLLEHVRGSHTRSNCSTNCRLA